MPKAKVTKAKRKSEEPDVEAPPIKRPSRAAKLKPTVIDESFEVEKEPKKQTTRRRTTKKPDAKKIAEKKETTKKPDAKKTTEKKENPDAKKTTEKKEKPDAKKIIEKKEKPNAKKKTEKKKEPDAKKTTEKTEKPDVKKTTEKNEKPDNKSDFSSLNVSCTRLNEKQQKYNLKISSWNIAGVRAWLKKGGLDYMHNENPDIFCLQEVKCSAEKIPNEIKTIAGYHFYQHCAEKEGYSGVALLSKRMPVEVYYGFGDATHDTEGRIITAEYKNYYVCCVYVPNSGRGLVTLSKRLDWNSKFLSYINTLNKKKPVIICGDLNVAHQEIDLKNPKTNKKTAGFTQEEREGMTEFLANGYVDVYRNLYPDKVEYTFWSFMSNSRSKNIGWRVDYFLLSDKILPLVCDCIIRTDVYGSDHCPLVLYINV